MSDHPTGKQRVHTSDPVPLLLWGNGFKTNDVKDSLKQKLENPDWWSTRDIKS